MSLVNEDTKWFSIAWLVVFLPFAHEREAVQRGCGSAVLACDRGLSVEYKQRVPRTVALWQRDESCQPPTKDCFPRQDRRIPFSDSINFILHINAPDAPVPDRDGNGHTRHGVMHLQDTTCFEPIYQPVDPVAWAVPASTSTSPVHSRSFVLTMPHSVGTNSAMSESQASTSTSSANAFPRPAGATMFAPEQYGDQFSPARSTSSFEEWPKSPPLNGLGSERFSDHSKTTRPITRGAPGEKKDTDAVGQNYGSRRRTQYYEEQFAYRDVTGSARERITKDSPVIAELRTNVIVCPWIHLFLPTPCGQFPFNYL